MMEVLNLVIYLMGSSNDKIVKYESLMCIKSILYDQYNTTDLKWDEILESVSPTVVFLLENFEKANIIWPVI